MSRKFITTLPVLFLILCCILALRPLDDYDIFMQIALGQASLKTVIPLNFEPYLQSIDVAYYANPGWLWQIFSASIINSLNIQIFRVIHIALFAGAILFAFAIQPIKKNSSGVTEALVLTLLPLLSSTSIRPQIVAFFFFALTYFILKRQELTLLRSVFLFSCFLIWQNCHPSVLIALPLIFLADNNSSLFSWFTKNRIQLAALCILASFCTPEGLSILTLSRHNLEISRDIFHVTEWYGYLELPVTFLPAFGICALLCTILLVVKRKELLPKEALLFTLFTALTLYSVRFVVFWSLITLPLLLKIFQEGNFTKLPFDPLATSPLLRRISLALALIGTGFAAYQTPLYSEKLPISCLQKLPEGVLQRTVFNDPDWGGLIAYLHKEHYRVLADGRLYLRDAKWWNTYLKHLSGKSTLSSISREYNPDIFVLSSKKSGPLAAELLSSNEWENTYMSLKDDGCSIYTRQQPTAERDSVLSVSSTESSKALASEADSVSTSFMRNSEAPAK